MTYPTTILETAKKAGIALPYSCEIGRCGNCVARCQSGQVWMSYNEVLTERELAKGLVLTCVGFPIGGDVTLEIKRYQRGLPLNSSSLIGLLRTTA